MSLCGLHWGWLKTPPPFQAVTRGPTRLRPRGVKRPPCKSTLLLLWGVWFNQAIPRQLFDFSCLVLKGDSSNREASHWMASAAGTFAPAGPSNPARLCHTHPRPISQPIVGGRGPEVSTIPDRTITGFVPRNYRVQRYTHKSWIVRGGLTYTRSAK